MNKMKTQNLLAAVTLMIMAAACGKNMSLQVDGGSDSQNIAPSTIDVTKISQENICTPSVGSAPGSSDGASTAAQLDSNESLQSYSVYDMNELKASLSESSILKRSTLQIAPKDAVTSVLKLDLVLNKAVIADVSKTSICIMETECRSLSAFIKDAAAEEITLDLREVFALKEKTDAEVMDWIYANTTEFARPGYRKFRFSFEGLTSLEGGAVLLQVTTNEKLPKDFATAPTCYEHAEDTIEAVVEEEATED
jgi:hypothetical protein